MNEFISDATPLFLGSGSPRRRQLLKDLGIPALARASSAPEDLLPGDTVPVFLDRIVRAKYRAALAQLDAFEAAGWSGAPPLEAPVPERFAGRCSGLLVADTIVVLDGDILGKPEDKAHARQLLSRLCGRTHSVWTAYAFAARTAAEPTRRAVETRVSMRAASAAEIERYADTGEGLDKAGAYAAQGLGVFLVERIEGSYTNVVGLPVTELITDLCAAGLLPRFPL